MSASLRALTMEEFLVWERAQPVRYEFDGTQPVAMTGGSPRHGLIIARLITAASNRVKAPCDVYASDVKVLGHDRVRYPDVTIACGSQDEADSIQPTVVFEVLSPSTSLTDRRVKPYEYRTLPSILAYVIVSQDEPSITILRRSSGWIEEQVQGRESTLALPEIGIDIPLSEIYR
jgi:Uma2 family endonuclease